ncbi:MAG: ABC transporter permease [Bacteroidales bacterium]|nr:ABC transporter permease [Bacteroidales bacterium]
MKLELALAKRLEIVSAGSSAAFTLRIASVSIILAIVVMIASIAIVSGFKSEIVGRLTDLQPHLRITAGNTQPGVERIVSLQEVESTLEGIDRSKIKSIALTAEMPCVLKTDSDFQGLALRGLSSEVDTTVISKRLVEGRMSRDDNDVVVSQIVARRLGINVGDRPILFFIRGDKIKQRRVVITGIYDTAMEEFDRNILFSNISLAQSIADLTPDQGTSVEFTLYDINNIDEMRDEIIQTVYTSLYQSHSSAVYQLSTVTDENISFFAWLELLDTNIIVILILMSIVAAFSLVAGLLIVVLNRTNMVGILKTLGASNRSIRLTFICLTYKLVLRSLLWGNIIGFAICLIQNFFHPMKLDPATYYMSYVPIEINGWLIVLNIGILIVSALAMIGPSYIITSLSPTKTIKFE